MNMTRFIVHSAFGLIAATALLAMPAEAKAQYSNTSVGVAVGSPGFGFSLGIGQPVYRPGPVVVPAYPGYPVYPAYPAYSPIYAPRPVVVAPAPYYPYRGYYPPAHYGPYRPYGWR
jgi:hypothetical protein